jgi:hypothetical protein
MRVEEAVATHPGPVAKIAARADHGPLPHLHAGLDDGKGLDGNGRRHLRGWVDEGAGVDTGGKSRRRGSKRIDKLSKGNRGVRDADDTEAGRGGDPDREENERGARLQEKRRVGRVLEKTGVANPGLT